MLTYNTPEFSPKQIIVLYLSLSRGILLSKACLFIRNGKMVRLIFCGCAFINANQKSVWLRDEPVLGVGLAPVSPPTLKLFNADLMALISSLFFLQVISFITVFQLDIICSLQNKVTCLQKVHANLLLVETQKF